MGAMGVFPIARRLLHVGLHQALEHLGVSPFGIVAVESDHSHYSFFEEAGISANGWKCFLQ